MKTEERIEQLKKEIEEKQSEIKRLGKNNWKPSSNEMYYTVNGYGEILKEENFEDGDNSKRFLIGNYFRTKEEAEFKVEQLKVYEELKHFAEPFDANKGQRSLYYSHEGESIEIGSLLAVKFPLELYFESEEQIREAIESVGEDRVLKYYLEVEK